MITMQGAYGTGYFDGLGTDWTSVANTVWDTAKDIVTSTPNALVNAATQNATNKLLPIAQQAVDAKAQTVIKKGNVAMFMLGGGALGALVAGGDWRRRTIGGIIIASAATAVGWQIGWLADK